VQCSSIECGFEYLKEIRVSKYCYKSSIIEPSEKEEVDVCSLCPDPDEVGLGECIGYECSGPTSPQHYKAEKVEINKCIYENGSVVVEYGYEDKCIGDEVIEYYCSASSGIPMELKSIEASSLGGIGRELVEKEAKKVYTQTVTCPYGCENGACICRDTDGPRNYYKKGSVVGTSITDLCVFREVIEYDPEVVNDECEIKEYKHLCGEGEICGDGACVLGTLCDNGVQDTGEEGIDCGGNCPTPCCENGIKNWFERDVDCGITCPPCCTPDDKLCDLACPPCDDANQKELGIEFVIDYSPTCYQERRGGGEEAALDFKEVMIDDLGWTCKFDPCVFG